jgi:F-type H+-transporting ATPase subunit b
MELVTPEIGLIFWTTVVFLLLVILLRRVAWGPILTAVDERNNSIKESLLAAEKARNEMSELTASNEKIIAQAKADRDILLKEAREMKSQIISQAKDKASIEAEKLVNSAKEQISNEKMKALTELKNHVADLSIEMAEKVLLVELSDSEKQKKLVNTALKENNN